jgi:hypothetical protein
MNVAEYFMTLNVDGAKMHHESHPVKRRIANRC